MILPMHHQRFKQVGEALHSCGKENLQHLTGRLRKPFAELRFRRLSDEEVQRNVPLDTFLNEGRLSDASTPGDHRHSGRPFF